MFLSQHPESKERARRWARKPITTVPSLKDLLLVSERAWSGEWGNTPQCVLWRWFSPSIFTSVPRIKPRSPGFHNKCLYQCTETFLWPPNPFQGHVCPHSCMENLQLNPTSLYNLLISAQDWGQRLLVLLLFCFDSTWAFKGHLSEP